MTACTFLAGQDVNVSIQPDDIHNVQVQVEYDGSVIVYSKGEEVEKDKETVLPIQVRGGLNFEQYAVVSERQAIRHYDKAHAKITIDEKSHDSELDNTNRNVNVYLAGEESLTKPILFSSEIDILKQSELELITTPFDFLSLSSFFSKDEAKVNEAWQPRDQDVVNALAIDRIYTNEVELTIKELTANQIKIYITGNATGEVDGEDISVNLRGVALIDNRNNFVKSLRVTMKENRNAGQIAPGFEGVIKLDLRASAQTTAKLVPRPLIARAREFRHQKLAWKPDNSFKIYFDPRWRLITDEDMAAVWRLIDNGDILAQCNVVQLPNRPSKNLLKLEDFRKEVGNIIDGSPAEVVGSLASTTSRGLDVLQVEVLGEEDDIPIRWVYNHVAQEDGRRLTFVFTVEDEVYDRFTPFGRSLIESVIFKTQKQEATAQATSPNQKKR
jgi:hypothetical protein